MKPELSMVALIVMLVCGGRATDSREATSTEKKFRHLESNARALHPDPAPTVLTEQEVNSYLASDDVRLPAGVQSVNLSGDSGIITGRAKVDFDRLRQGADSPNPLLVMFSGIHDVVVVAPAHGSGGKGYLHIESFALDGVRVPRFVLELFVEKFLRPKYPELGLDSQFRLPAHVNTATVGLHTLTVTQN